MKKTKNMADLAHVTAMSALARRCEDLALELHGLSNELHKAGLHRQGTVADVAAGMIEDLMDE